MRASRSKRSKRSLSPALSTVLGRHRDRPAAAPCEVVQGLTRRNRPTLGLALSTLRIVMGWSQIELSKASGFATSQISQCESGKIRLTRARFNDFAAVMGAGEGLGECAVATCALLSAVAAPADSVPQGGLTHDERQQVNAFTLRMLPALAELVQERAAATILMRRADVAHQDANAHWRVLATLTHPERRQRLETGLHLQTWAMCLRLCDASVAAGAHSVTESMQLAELSVRAAQLARGDAGGLRRLQGYARGFLANAYRSRGDLTAADTEFAAATRQWDEGGQVAEFALPEWRLLDLQSSLRLAQKVWPAAVSLLDRAIALAPDEESGRLLVKKATALRLAGRVDDALASLDAAAPLVKLLPEMQWMVQYHQVVCLCQIGRYREADECLQSLGGALAGESTLDILRQLWLKARVAAGHGDRRQAIADLEWVRTELKHFASHYESALMSIDLAVLYFDGREGSSKIRALVRTIFETVKLRWGSRALTASLDELCQSAVKLWQLHEDLELVRTEDWVFQPQTADGSVRMAHVPHLDQTDAVSLRDETSVLVRVLRAIPAFSQDAMSAAVSIDRTTISRYETGSMVPSRAYLARLGNAAGISLPLLEGVLLPAVRLVCAKRACAHRSWLLTQQAGEMAAAFDRQLVATIRAGVATFAAAVQSDKAR
jgi:transcriptional regulator with XRE-family HTH domain